MKDYKLLSDEDLVDLVKKGQQDFYAEIMRRYKGRLLRYAQYLLLDKNQAADVVQEAFIKAYINLHGFNTKRKFSSWIYRIVHNQAVNLLKKERRWVRMSEKLDFEDKDELQEDLVRKELKENLQACLQNMPVIYKEPLVLYYLEEKTYDQISEILRLPQKTVATRLRRAKSLLKNICQRKKVRP